MVPFHSNRTVTIAPYNRSIWIKPMIQKSFTKPTLQNKRPTSCPTNCWVSTFLSSIITILSLKVYYFSINNIFLLWLSVHTQFFVMETQISYWMSTSPKYHSISFLVWLFFFKPVRSSFISTHLYLLLLSPKYSHLRALSGSLLPHLSVSWLVFFVNLTQM